MNRLATSLIGAGVLSAATSASAQCVISVLRSDLSDQLGRYVALDGGTVVTSARGLNQDGAIYIFEQNAEDMTEWTEVQRIDGNVVGHPLGGRIALDGDRFLTSTSNPYLALVYERQPDNTWAEVDSIPLPWHSPRLALAGDIAVIAVADEVKVYQHDESGWTFLQDLDPGAVPPGQDFGYDVDIDGIRILVTAHGAAGLAYIFDATGDDPPVWTLTQTLQPAAAGSGYGISGALSGDIAVIGQGNDGNRIFVHERNYGGPDNWGDTTEFTGSSAFNFGFRVAAENDWVVTTRNMGAHLFERMHDDPPDNWNATHTFGGADGLEVAMSNGIVAKGNMYDDVNGNDRGSVTLYQLPGGADCNENGVEDACEVIWDQARDCNYNHVPDECEPSLPPCLTDLDGSCWTDFQDLGVLLGYWGPCRPGAECQIANVVDTGSSTDAVDFDDLSIVLSVWGSTAHSNRAYRQAGQDR